MAVDITMKSIGLFKETIMLNYLMVNVDVTEQLYELCTYRLALKITKKLRFWDYDDIKVGCLLEDRIWLSKYNVFVEFYISSVFQIQRDKQQEQQQTKYVLMRKKVLNFST